MNKSIGIFTKELKGNISKLIEKGKLDDAKLFLKQYENIVHDDIEIYSIKAVVNIMENRFEEAEKILKNGLDIDGDNFDLNYNLGYLYEQKGEYLNAIETYEKIVFNMQECEQRQEIIKYLNNLEQEFKGIIQKQLETKRILYNNNQKENSKDLNLHLLYDSNYCDKFIHFVNEHFDNNKHKFIIIASRNQQIKFMHIDGIENAEFLDLNTDLNKLLNYIDNCSKIFIHYLFDYFCELVCRFNIKKEMCWIYWGGDLYNHINIKMYDKITENFLIRKGFLVNSKVDKNDLSYIYRKSTMRRLAHILISNKEDYNKIKQEFISDMKYNIFTYPNPIDFTLIKKDDIKISNKLNERFKYLILVGNSGNPSNNHLEILHELKKVSSKDFGVIVPLSYGGPQKYINSVIEEGKKILPNQFIPLTEYIQSNEYFNILNQIDVAIYNHNRQQARGNIRVLLYLGKKVYIKDTITTYPYFKNLDLKLYDIVDIKNKKIEDIVSMNTEDKINNRIIIESNFSNDNCLEYMKSVFEK